MAKSSRSYELSPEQFRAAIEADFVDPSNRRFDWAPSQVDAIPRLQGLYQLQGIETGRFHSCPPLQQLFKESNPMQHTGDRCCIAAGTQIIFEGTEAECRAHAKKFIEGDSNGYGRVTVYAPLAVLSQKREVVTTVEVRDVMKVRK